MTDAPTGRSRLVTGAMLGLASGAILVPLNSTMLAVALPSIMREFDVGAAAVASLVTLYLGAVAIALPASGSLGDRYGHRAMFLVGVAGFAAASALAATAATFEILAVSRVLQAVTGAFVSTSSVALLRMTAPDDRQGSAFGVFDMLISVSAALGPLIGGLLVGGLGWRSIFFVVVPIAVFAGVAVALVVPRRPIGTEREHRSPSRPIDIPGLGLLAASLIALLLGLRGLETGGQEAVALLVAPALLAVFVWFERRTPHPAIDPRLFASRAFLAAVIGVFGSTVILHATFVLVPLLVETLQGDDAAMSGLVLLGISAMWGIAAPIGGRLSDSVGRREPVVLGTLVSAAGLVALWLVAPEASNLWLGALLAVVGFGMGLAGAPRLTAAMEVIEPERVGMAAGTYLTGRYLGGALGATLAGAVLGGTVTATGVSTGFGILALVAFGVAVVSMRLPTRRPVDRLADSAA